MGRRKSVENSPIGDVDWNEVERSFQLTSPYNYAIIDNFFTQQALELLRKDLLSHWGWSSISREGHEVFLRNFEHPILQGIISGLKKNLTTILAKKECVANLAFMYIRNVGIHPHSDLAAVSVNTWLTPDEFNLDPNSGGLVLYDVKREEDMMVHLFNSAPYCVEYFKEKTKGNKVVIPYRCNRTIIFDSGTFHSSDRMNFVNKGGATTRMNFGLSFDDPDRYRMKFEPYGFAMYKPLQDRKAGAVRQEA